MVESPQTLSEDHSPSGSISPAWLAADSPWPDDARRRGRADTARRHDPECGHHAGVDRGKGAVARLQGVQTAAIEIEPASAVRELGAGCPLCVSSAKLRLWHFRDMPRHQKDGRF